MKEIKFNNLFAWSIGDGKKLGEFPFYASINMVTNESMNIKTQEIEWLVCPEDVTQNSNKGQKIYRLVEITQDEIDEINKLTSELVKLDG